MPNLPSLCTLRQAADIARVTAKAAPTFRPAPRLRPPRAPTRPQGPSGARGGPTTPRPPGPLGPAGGTVPGGAPWGASRRPPPAPPGPPRGPRDPRIQRTRPNANGVKLGLEGILDVDVTKGPGELHRVAPAPVSRLGASSPRGAPPLGPRDPSPAGGGRRDGGPGRTPARPPWSASGPMGGSRAGGGARPSVGSPQDPGISRTHHARRGRFARTAERRGDIPAGRWTRSYPPVKGVSVDVGAGEILFGLRAPDRAPPRPPRLSPAAAGPPRPPRARPRGGVRGRPDDGRIPGCRGRRTSPASPSPPPAAPPRGQRRGAPLWPRRATHGGHRAPRGPPRGAAGRPGWGAVRGRGGTRRPRPPSRAPPRTARGT